SGQGCIHSDGQDRPRGIDSERRLSSRACWRRCAHSVTAARGCFGDDVTQNTTTELVWAFHHCAVDQWFSRDPASLRVRLLGQRGPTITIDICDTPTVTSQPAGQTVAYGQAANLTVSATSGTGSLSYQWYRGASGNTANPVGNGTSTIGTGALTAD